MPHFEQTFRWDQIDLTTDPDGQWIPNLLETRDREIEAHLDSLGACTAFFFFRYRWEEIYPLFKTDLQRAVSLLEERDRELMDHLNRSSGTDCSFEYTYTWAQIADLIQAEDNAAIACLEANDQALETALSACTCGTPTLDLATFQTVGLITSGASHIDTVGSGFGSFTLLADAPLNAFRPSFGYNASGLISGGTCALYTVVGATETLVHSFTVPSGSSADLALSLGPFTAGTVFRMRTVGIVTDTNDFSGTFDYFSTSPSFAFHEWVAE